jgi:hypothetical protein
MPTNGPSIPRKRALTHTLIEGEGKVQRKGSFSWDPALPGEKFFEGDLFRAPETPATFSSRTGAASTVPAESMSGFIPDPAFDPAAMTISAKAKDLLSRLTIATSKDLYPTTQGDRPYSTRSPYNPWRLSYDSTVQYLEDQYTKDAARKRRKK